MRVRRTKQWLTRDEAHHDVHRVDHDIFPSYTYWKCIQLVFLITRRREAGRGSTTLKAQIFWHLALFFEKCRLPKVLRGTALMVKALKVVAALPSCPSCVVNTTLFLP